MLQVDDLLTGLNLQKLSLWDFHHDTVAVRSRDVELFVEDFDELLDFARERSMDVLVDRLRVSVLVIAVLWCGSSFGLHEVVFACQQIAWLALSFARRGLALLGFHLVIVVCVEVARAAARSALAANFAEVDIVGVFTASISAFAYHIESRPVSAVALLLGFHELLAHNLIEVDTIDFFFVGLVDHSVALLLALELLKLALELLRILNLLVLVLVHI